MTLGLHLFQTLQRTTILLLMSLISTQKQFKCILFNFMIFIILYNMTGAVFLGTARLFLDCGGGNFGTLSQLVGIRW
ncbi:hypothetical protein BJX62DRAFT_201922 [Aspergillus germanicus]